MTDEQYAREKWVSRYIEAKKYAEHLRQKYHRLGDQATSVTPNLSGMPSPHGCPSDKVGQAAAERADLMDDIIEQERMCSAVIHQIESAVSRVDDFEHRQILHSRYLEGMPWQDIADEMNYSLRSVHRKKLDALDVLPLVVTYNDGKYIALYPDAPGIIIDHGDDKK